jgi:hypothetical protein
MEALAGSDWLSKRASNCCVAYRSRCLFKSVPGRVISNFDTVPETLAASAGEGFYIPPKHD